MKIVLFQPRIPQNAGNIVRTCAVTGSDLIMVKPLGFSTSSRMLKRAGLDYWNSVNITLVDDLLTLLDATNVPFSFFSTKGQKIYTEKSYHEDELLIFGSETSGLPDIIHDRFQDQIYTIPMKSNYRSLNLSNSVSIVLYEGLRQQSFSSIDNRPTPPEEKQKLN